MRISDWSSDVCSSDLHDSAKLVSDLLGQETVVFESMSLAIDAEETGISFGSQHVGRPLLTPDEVRTLRQALQLLFPPGQLPIVAAQLRSFAARTLPGTFAQVYSVSTAPNPSYSDLSHCPIS